MPGFIKDEGPVGLRLERLLQRARAILAVPKDADRVQIREAFTRMVRYHHPDTTTAAHESHQRMMRKEHPEVQSPSLSSIRAAKDLLIKQLKDEK